jgi:hypothetical protein
VDVTADVSTEIITFSSKLQNMIQEQNKLFKKKKGK